MVDSEAENIHEEATFEFDFSLPLGEYSDNLNERHTKIGSILKIPNDTLHRYIFVTVAALVDPFTQPEETDDFILSVDSVSDLFIALTYSKMSVSNEVIKSENISDCSHLRAKRFLLSLKYFELLILVNEALNVNDESKLRSIDNEDDWEDQLHLWIPNKNLKDKDLRVVYSIACVIITSIFKLIPRDEKNEVNLSTNPYLHYFITLWKCHTDVIVLGLEIDRKVEADSKDSDGQIRAEVPDIVYQAVNGSSSVRYVLGWILNSNPSSLVNEEGFHSASEEEFNFQSDLEKQTLLHYIQPLGRNKVNGGALSIDMRLVVIALLILKSGIVSFPSLSKLKDGNNDSNSTGEASLSSSLSDIGDILIDLEYDDKFEEDIRYMFEIEYDGLDDAWSDVVENETVAEAPSEVVDESSKFNFPSTAVRSNESIKIDFDEFGRDWRDIPREENQDSQDWFVSLSTYFDKLPHKSDSDDFFATWTEVKDTLDFLIVNSIEDNSSAEKRIGQALINTVAKAVRNEEQGVKSTITPDAIYEYLSAGATDEAIQTTQDNNKMIIPIVSIRNAELFFHNNRKLARCVIDEMFMSKGYRRVLIWYITHNFNLSIVLIDYVFSLLVGVRGSDDKQKPYRFTRKGGKLILSEIEKSMLLHEFLSASSRYLSESEGYSTDESNNFVLAESIAEKYMSLICLMLNQLIKIGILNLSNTGNDDKDDIDDYSNDIQVLLVNWIGKLPEARELFFRVKKANYETHNENTNKCENTLGNDKNSSDDSSKEKQANLIKKYAQMSSSDISNDLKINPENVKPIARFAERIELHLKKTLKKYFKEFKDEKEVHDFDSRTVSEDFGFFLLHFNILCKIEFLAEWLFERFDPYLNGDNESSLASRENAPEAEFNERFLDGHL